MTLKLANGLCLPPDAVTQTVLIVGKRGSGKSNTAARLVEQLYHARLPFVVLDPVDTWWGLKAGRNGGKGLDVYVFGGRHADLPLEAGAGALIAEVVCEHKISMVLSAKHLSGRERSTFMVAFAQTLFQKWAGGPLHLVLEEAHELAPQNTQNAKEGEQQMLGAFKRLWKLGRSSGIGGTAITQRPASLSKDITTQSEILIAHRTIGPQDVKAVGEWVKHHGEHLDILADLPTLPTGEAFVWAPEFPEGQPIGLKRTAILLRDTYDSASTPKVGERRIEPKELAPVDLERLRVKMAATIEKVKADDPRELRRQIAALKSELDKGSRSAPSAPLKLSEADGKRVEKLTAAITDAVSLMHEDLVLAGQRLKSVLDTYISAMSDTAARAEKALRTVLEKASVQKVIGKVSALSASANTAARSTWDSTQTRVSNALISQPGPIASSVAKLNHVAKGKAHWTPPLASSDVKLNRLAERKVLQVLAVHGPRTKRQLAIQSGYAAGGGGFLGALSKLKTAGLIHSNGSGTLAITDAGAAAIGDVDPLPTGSELVAYWLQQFNRLAEREVLRVLVEAYPSALTADEVASRTQPTYEPKGGGFLGAVSKLRTLGLIEGRGELRASEDLFHE